MNNIHKVNIIHDRFSAAVMARSIGSSGRRQSVPRRWMIVVGLDVGPSFVILIGRSYAGSLSLPRFPRGKQGFSTNFDVEFYARHINKNISCVFWSHVGLPNVHSQKSTYVGHRKFC